MPATLAMPRPVIELQDVSLCYRLAKQRIPSFKEYALHWMRGALTYEQLWALREVSLRVNSGESLGIIGRNGAGKSTLLKVISRVLPATAGRVHVRGRVAPMLELGSGFDFELTGQENIFLNALLLGHARREIEERFDSIVEFSGLADFIRSPIRNYSTGMLSRLAFSVLTAWKPEVLVLDESLAVGDVHFVKKCEERIEELQAHGTTLLLVSHIAEAVRAHCRRCVWLEAGRLRADGSPDEILALYEESSEAAVASGADDATVTA
jgi:ABC-2 type transport system ATP-binding protein/lipopolysaccharide transport system ATP-binding protein